jgi:hypothetical protein
MADTLSAAYAKNPSPPLKTGRLFDVQNWITSGKSLHVPAELYRTPLEVTLNMGFHTWLNCLPS